MSKVLPIQFNGEWLAQEIRREIMNRKKITKFLETVLIDTRLSGTMGKYWASEVSVDYGTKNVRRVDFMQFSPAGVTSVGDIEKGYFTCYEVKSCIEDVYSGNGLNFISEKNYIVTTMECYKKLLEDMRSNKFYKHMDEYFPESSPHFGVMVPIPKYGDIHDEFENPTAIDNESHNWELKIVYNCHHGVRNKSMTELLFYMLRSGK